MKESNQILLKNLIFYDREIKKIFSTSQSAIWIAFFISNHKNVEPSGSSYFSAIFTVISDKESKVIIALNLK